MTPTDKAAFLTAMQLLTQQVVAIQQGPTPPPDGVDSFVLPSKSAMGLNEKPTMPGRACAPRKRFSTAEAARAAGVRAGRLVEPCHHCNGWHLA